MELFTPNACAEPSTLLFSTSIAPQLQFLLISSDYAENCSEPLERLLQLLMGYQLFSAYTDTQFQSLLSCSFYLYRFRKYVSYGFPIINFCNPRIHYETPCILSNLFTGHPYKSRDSSVVITNRIRTARSEVRTPAAAKYLHSPTIIYETEVVE